MTGRNGNPNPGFKPSAPMGPGFNPFIPRGPGFNPFVPGGPAFNPFVPAGAGFNPFARGGPGFNPFIPGGPGFNPFAPGVQPQAPNRPNNDLPGGQFANPQDFVGKAPQGAGNQPLKNGIQDKKPGFGDFDRLARELKDKEVAFVPVKTVENPTPHDKFDAPVQDLPPSETKAIPEVVTGLEERPRQPVQDPNPVETKNEMPRQAPADLAAQPSAPAGSTNPVLVFIVAACIIAALGAAVGLAIHLERHDEQVIAGRNQIVSGLGVSLTPSQSPSAGAG